MRREPNAFWTYSLATYRAPAVAAACLALQDGCGADVNLLLYCCWLGQGGRALNKAALRAAMAAVAAWQAAVVKPLRQARRALKHPPQGVPAAAAGALRKRIGAIELDLEYVEQRLLADAAARLPPAARRQAPELAAAANLDRYLALLDVPPDHPERRHVATILAACFPPDAQSS